MARLIDLINRPSLHSSIKLIGFPKITSLFFENEASAYREKFGRKEVYPREQLRPSGAKLRYPLYDLLQKGWFHLAVISISRPAIVLAVRNPPPLAFLPPVHPLVAILTCDDGCWCALISVPALNPSLLERFSTSVAALRRCTRRC